MAKIETPRLNGSVLDFGLGSMQGSSSKSMAEIEELELCLEYIGERKVATVKLFFNFEAEVARSCLGGEDEGSKVDDGNEALESEAGQEGTTLAKIKRPTPVCPAPVCHLGLHGTIKLSTCIHRSNRASTPHAVFKVVTPINDERPRDISGCCICYNMVLFGDLHQLIWGIHYDQHGGDVRSDLWWGFIDGHGS